MKVTEIFFSIQGESTYTGLPFTFVRFTGCNLRCGYCDSPFAFSGGTEMPPSQILEEVSSYNCRRVLLTGGEPLLQEDLGKLIDLLDKNGIEVFIETNGSLPVKYLDRDKVRAVILDVKTPGSGESEKTVWDNLTALLPHDEVKFVLTSREDFDWSINVLKDRPRTEGMEIIFTPARPVVEPADLAKWVLDSNAEVRMGLQLHKVIWPFVDRGV